jgi:hypothetical protein
VHTTRSALPPPLPPPPLEPSSSSVVMKSYTSSAVWMAVPGAGLGPPAAKGNAQPARNHLTGAARCTANRQPQPEGGAHPHTRRSALPAAAALRSAAAAAAARPWPPPGAAAASCGHPGRSGPPAAGGGGGASSGGRQGLACPGPSGSGAPSCCLQPSCLALASPAAASLLSLSAR